MRTATRYDALPIYTRAATKLARQTGRRVRVSPRTGVLRLTFTDNPAPRSKVAEPCS